MVVVQVCRRLSRTILLVSVALPAVAAIATAPEADAAAIATAPEADAAAIATAPEADAAAIATAPEAAGATDAVCRNLRRFISVSWRPPTVCSNRHRSGRRCAPSESGGWWRR